MAVWNDAVNGGAHERAERRRASWIARWTALEEQGLPPVASSPEERLASRWSLAEETWLLSGREPPHHTRADIPGRLLRDELE